MTFLPIVERELRVASRRPLTWWTRLSAALIVLVLFGGMQVLIGLSRGGMGISAGQIQFMVLKWIVFVAACAAGVFLTSDALSEEKREGTLGLLFLTDLRGYDVVLGKLLSHSLRAFYGLLAALPVLALTILNGGVNGTEFFRVVLVICNTLFFSLSLGLLVSSLSRDSIKAMSGAALLGVFFFLMLPWLDLSIAQWDMTLFKPILSMASPGYLFSVANGWGPPEYWTWLGLQHALAWFFLLLATLRVPRSWQDRATVEGTGRSAISNRWRFGGPRRLALRRRLLDLDPVLWLALRDRWSPRMVMTLAVLVLVEQCWNFLREFAQVQNSTGAFAVHVQMEQFVTPLLSFGLVLWVVSQASRFFIEGNRTGALELLLATPVGPAQIVRAQWRALLRTFMFPAAVIIVLQGAGGILSVLRTQKMLAASMAAAKASGAANVVSGYDFAVPQIVGAVLGMLAAAAGFAALAWFGMWAGLTTRKNAFAVLKTICFVSVLPTIAIVFAQIFVSISLIRYTVTGGPPARQFQMWFTMLLSPGFSLAKDAFFIFWSRRRLLTRFRETVAAGGGTSRNRPARIIPATAPAVADAKIG
jgi:ABC-type transport system involved in multi-copper enzyme maturation permease subunit